MNNIRTPEELLDYMNKNVIYGFVGKNGKHYTDMFSEEWKDFYSQCFVQTGEEVLESNIGTCWDQVELERLWFEKHNYKFHTFFMWFEVGRECDYPTHTFLIYEDNNKYYWFEHAFEAQRGIHEFNSLDEAIECVKSKQIEHTKMNFKEATEEEMNCLVVYEYSKPNGSLNVDEYLSHVTSNIENIHSIIIIKKDNKYLNYYDERWGMYLFPNIKGNDMEEIKKKYNTNNVKYLFDKVHDKYSISHNENRTYHHYFFEVDTDIDGEYFTFEELLSDPKVKENNSDIITYIKNYYNK